MHPSLTSVKHWQVRLITSIRKMSVKMSSPSSTKTQCIFMFLRLWFFWRNFSFLASDLPPPMDVNSTLIFLPPRVVWCSRRAICTQYKQSCVHMTRWITRYRSFCTTIQTRSNSSINYKRTLKTKDFMLGKNGKFSFRIFCTVQMNKVILRFEILILIFQKKLKQVLTTI